MNRFSQRIAAFMQGRCGLDGLGRFLLVLSMIFLLISIMIRPVRFLYAVGIGILLYEYYRMFSRNVSKRYQENMRFMSFVNGQRQKFAQRKTHKIFKCPNCTQKIRVPKGKGKICIKCPKCRIEFIKRT